MIFLYTKYLYIKYIYKFENLPQIKNISDITNKEQKI